MKSSVFQIKEKISRAIWRVAIKKISYVIGLNQIFCTCQNSFETSFVLMRFMRSF